MPAEAPFADAVRALVSRVGGAAQRVTVEELGAGALREGEVAAGEAEASRGVLTLRGTDAIAATAALARYLARHVGRRLTWEAPALEPPLDTWPDAPLE